MKELVEHLETDNAVLEKKQNKRIIIISLCLLCIIIISILLFAFLPKTAAYIKYDSFERAINNEQWDEAYNYIYEFDTKRNTGEYTIYYKNALADLYSDFFDDCSIQILENCNGKNLGAVYDYLNDHWGTFFMDDNGCKSERSIFYINNEGELECTLGEDYFYNDDSLKSVLVNKIQYAENIARIEEIFKDYEECLEELDRYKNNTYVKNTYIRVSVDSINISLHLYSSYMMDRDCNYTDEYKSKLKEIQEFCEEYDDNYIYN